MKPTNEINEIPASGMAITKMLVNYSPRLPQYVITKFTGRIGQSATMECLVRGYPDLTVTWKLRGSIVTSQRKTDTKLDEHVSIVTRSSVTESDIGEYQCEAQNSLKKEIFKINLLKPGVPDPPMYCIRTGSTHLGVTLNCLAGYDGGEELNFYVQKHDSPHNGDATCTTSWPEPRHAVLQVGNLWPNSNFTLHVFGTNKHGRSSQPYKIHVTTINGPTPPTPPGPNTAAIVGGVFGALGVVVLVILVIVLVRNFGTPDVRAGIEKIQNSKTVQGWKKKREEARWKNKYHTDEDEEESKTSSSENLTKKSERSEIPYDKRYKNMSRHVSIPNEYEHLKKNRRGILKNSSIEEGIEFDNPGYNVETNFDERIPVSRPLSLIGQGAMGQTNDIPLGGVPVAGGSLGGARQKTTPKRPSTGGAIPKKQGVSFENPAACGGDWEYPPEMLEIRDKLGEGCFGEVWMAVADDVETEEGKRFVAVKMLKERSPLEERRALLKELDTMKILRPHPNIIQLLGCCTGTENIYIIMEYASEGNLQDFLRRNRNTSGAIFGRTPLPSQSLTSRDLCMFALHVASGMQYISSRELIHRDLAARNILVDDTLTCKISDFGFARDIRNCRQYESKTQRRLPIRWMAPESLYDNIYTVESDIWSFGVVLWEIVTLGSSPYPGKSGADVMELIQFGHRMEQPRYCSDSMYTIMLNCWHHDPSYRPSFTSVCEGLAAILDENNLPLTHLKENLYAILDKSQVQGEKC